MYKDAIQFLHIDQSQTDQIGVLSRQIDIFKTICNTITTGIVLSYVDSDAQIEYINPHALAMLGYTAAQLHDELNNQIIRFTLPDDIPEVLRNFRRVASLQSPEDKITFRTRARTREGNIIWLMGSGMLAQDCRERALAVFTFENITGQHDLELALAETKSEYDGLLEIIQGGVHVCMIDELLSLIYANEGFYHLIGYSKAEFERLFSNKYALLLDENTRDVHIAEIRQQLGESGSYSVEYTLVGKSGRTIWVLDKGCYIATEAKHQQIQSLLTDITELKLQQEQLKIARQRYEIAISHTDLLIFEYDVAANKLLLPKINSKRFGIQSVTQAHLETVLQSGMVSSGDISKVRQLFQSIADGIAFVSQEVILYDVDRQETINELSLTAIYDNAGQPTHAVGVLKDITDTKRLERDQKFLNAMTADKLLSCEANITRDALTNIGHKWFKQLNIPYFTKYSQLMEFITDRKVHPDWRNPYLQFCSAEHIINSLRRGEKQLIMELRIHNGDGDYFWIQSSVNIIRDDLTQDIKIRRYVKNIQEEKKKELDLLYRAQRDGLTTFYNRDAVELLISDYLASSRGKNGKHAFLILDIDHFKSINDNFGHKFGDKVLKDSAHKLKTLFREDDIIGRIGGDEFVILMKNIPSAEFAVSRAQAICQSLRYTYHKKDVSYQISVSIGIAIFGVDGKVYEELYRNSDSALYCSKNNGRNQASSYQPE